MVLVNTFSMSRNIAKQLEVPERRYSRMLRRDSNSNSNMSPKRKPSCAETSKCTAHANSVTLAHMLMENINSKRRPISQVISKPSFALNSIKKDFAYMVKDASSYTASSIGHVSLLTLKLLRKEPDLLT